MDTKTKKMENKKEKKIDVAVRDTQLRLNKVNEDLMLILKEKDVLQIQLSTLETIKDNDGYE